MSTIAISKSPLDLLARSLESSRQHLTSDAARYLLSLELTPQDRQHLDELAKKARHGTLTAAEQKELDETMRIGRIIDVLKSQARQALRSE